jgi:hypothetical protein
VREKRVRRADIQHASGVRKKRVRRADIQARLRRVQMSKLQRRAYDRAFAREWLVRLEAG